MNTQFRKTIAAVATIGGLIGTSIASAAPIDLTPPATPFVSSSVGDSRSVVLRDDTAYALTALGLYMDPLVASFNLTAEIFAFNIGTGTRGALLSTATQSFADTGFGFYDVAVAAALAPGQYYELNLKTFGIGTFDVQFYNFNGALGGGTDAPFAVGPVTVFDGCGDGNVSGCGNTVLANFEINGTARSAAAVPEPGTMALLGIAVAGAAVGRRRKARPA